MQSSSAFELSVLTETVYTVTMDIADNAKAWKFTDKDITVVDCVQVVSLEPSNISLRNFIIQDPDLISSSSRGRLTVTTMQGYRDLMQKRNLAQAKLLVEEDTSAAACTLFGPTAPKAKKPKQQAATPQLVDVSFTVGREDVTVRMVKPLVNRDVLQVEFDSRNPVALTHVIRYIRELGFEKITVYESRNDDKSLPPGVWRRKDRKGGQVYVTKSTDGQYRRFSSLQEAIVAKSSDEQTPCHSPSPSAMPESSPNPESSLIGGGGGDHDEEQNADDSGDDACKITF